MDTQPEYLEKLWEDLLSRQPELVRSAFASLDPASQETVLTHLQHMAQDPGWQPEQRKSARDAIRALENHPKE